MKLKIGLFILLTLLMIFSSSMFYLYNKELKERKIAETNLEAKSSELRTYVTKLGDTVSVLQGLRLDLSQAKKVEKRLMDKVNSLETKLKNATGVIEIVEKIKYVNKDSIVYIPLTDSIRRFEINDRWLRAKVDIVDFKYIPPGGFVIDSIPNTITIVPSVKTKGWWFWKRVIGVECFIQNTNPYLFVESGIYIDLRKLK